MPDSSDLSDTDDTHDDAQSIEELSKKYLRIIDEQEQLLGKWAEEFYEPGYLTDEEWDQLKDLVRSSTDWDAIQMMAEIAIFRQGITEMGEATSDDDWPAAPGGRS